LKATGNTEKLNELQKNAGSEDYRNAKGVMKATFVKVVNDDVTPVLNEIRCPVLLVWGDQDTAAPLWMGQQMEQMMPDAGLAIFEGDDHWAYWHQADRFNRVLDAFLKGDMQA
ncbi:MAG: alpha/beta hydrolase, partial [Solobacterium sp.]|nr:alpha/beta hydrolase [Solobacterium sp.]